MPLPSELHLIDIDAKGRVRSDMGDIKALADSIKEFGLIQPIVLAHGGNGTEYRLVAGGRRFTALTQLGFGPLVHGRDFIWREEQFDGDDTAKMRLQSIELEENLRRKDLLWPEICVGKKRLLEIQQRLHGVATAGGQSVLARAGVVSGGFGIRKLGAMLGESAAQVSKDVQLAAMVEKIPALANASSKQGAITMFKTMFAKFQASKGMVPTTSATPQAAKPIEYRIMVFCNDEAHQLEVLARLETEGLKCQLLIV